MAEQFVSKRLRFTSPKEQALFMEKVCTRIGKSNALFALQFNIHSRTWRDWRVGRFHLPLSVAQALSKQAAVSIPSSAKIYDLKDHLRKIAIKGGNANLKKNGTIGGPAEYRKEKWKEWWLKKGQFAPPQPILYAKRIRVPEKNAVLAEFVGIMMGDGGVAPYHVSITLDSRTDKKYSKFVQKLLHDLFQVQPKTYAKKASRCLDIIIQRKALVDLCRSLGLPQGNKLKQGLDIPDWIHSRPEWRAACIRGLFDTDGSIFKHTYISKGKRYSYIKAGFTSKSPALIQSVYEILRNLGINARISGNWQDVRIEAKADIARYFKRIGSNNPKHLEKYNSWKGA